MEFLKQVVKGCAFMIRHEWGHYRMRREWLAVGVSTEVPDEMVQFLRAKPELDYGMNEPVTPRSWKDAVSQAYREADAIPYIDGKGHLQYCYPAEDE